jgi:hypothetical protein
MKKLEVTGKLAGKGTSVAWLNAPFDVIKVFGTRARVPVRGTINGLAFRSSLMPMGGCRGMAINKSMRDGAGVKAGDTVSVVMERDEGKRIVEAPALRKKEMAKSKTAQAKREKLSFTNKKRSRFQSARLNKRNAPAPTGEGDGYPEDWQEMDGLGFQASHHFRDVVLLKKTNPGNASRARIKTVTSVLERNTTESKHGHLLSTNFTQSLEAGWT